MDADAIAAGWDIVKQLGPDLYAWRGRRLSRALERWITAWTAHDRKKAGRRDKAIAATLSANPSTSR